MPHRNKKTVELGIETQPRLPKAIYFIIPNELCERFCFYGIGALNNQYLKSGFSFDLHTAKSITHLFSSLIYLCPLLGAALSDSYFGKYKTILVLSIVYLIGNLLLTIFSINGLVGNFGSYPLWSYLVPLILISLGAGGIKPCVASHGGDQFHSGQKYLMDVFFSIFQASINIGILLALMTTPYLKLINCFGSDCYPLAFGVPTFIFGISLIIFVIGSKYYQVVLPEGEFLPWKMSKLIKHAANNWYAASKLERQSKSNWLKFASPKFNNEFIDQTRCLLQIIVMFIPICFAWMLSDQCGTEWQNQYELMDKYLLGVYVPTEASSLVRTLLVIVLIPFFSYVVYPWLDRRGVQFTFAMRISIGWFTIILAFICATTLNIWVYQFANPVYENGLVVKCDGCLNGLWQLPQMFLHSLGDAMLSPGCVLFAYTHVPNMKAIAFSIYLLSISFGNQMVMILEFPLQALPNPGFRQIVYIVLSGLALLLFVILNLVWLPSPPPTKFSLDPIANLNDDSKFKSKS